jgi:VWFA-related protein
MHTSRALTAVTLSLLIAFPSAAQRREQNFGEAVQVSIIEVPVTVVDRDGNSVRGLTRENFELYDDGKRVDIEYFETVDMNKVTGEPVSIDHRLPPVASRNFLLLFDLENSSSGTIARAREAAQTFIDSLGELDLLSIGSFSAERGVQLYTAFSGDRVLARAAVSAVGTTSFRTADPLMLKDVPPGPRSAVQQAMHNDRMEDHNTAAQKFSDNEMRNRLRVQFTSFGKIAQTLNRLHGQKQVVLLTEGFDARLVQGRDDLSAPQTAQEREQIFHGQPHKVDTDQRFGNTTSSRDLNEMIQMFRRADVVLHAIDIAGLRSNVDAAEGARASRVSNESLFLLTTPTGGTVFKNANDLTNNFKRMLKQQEIVYLLGFNAKVTGAPGKFHNVRVKTVNVPRNARVSHRAGYFESSPMLTDLEKVITLAEIVTNDLPIDDVAVSIAATAMPGNNGGNARVPVVVEIPGKRLLEGLTTPTATATLFLYAFDEKNRVHDHLEQRIAVDVAQAGSAVKDNGIRYYGTLRVPQGHYALKALVRVEESGRIGFARSDIHVPAFDNAVVLPPLVFAAPENWLMLVGPSRGDDFPYPFAAGDDKYVPRNNAQLTANGEYKLALFLYRVPIEGLDLAPVVASADGSVTKTANLKLVGRTSADESGGTKLLLSFKPEGLQAGDYELQLTVTPREGSASLVRMPFVLR